MFFSFVVLGLVDLLGRFFGRCGFVSSGWGSGLLMVIFLRSVWFVRCGCLLCFGLCV